MNRLLALEGVTLVERSVLREARAVELTRYRPVEGDRYGRGRIGEGVIDDGRVVEAGSHAELMANDGLYAELYELQARSYR